jgi:hypothetical protein
VLLSSILVAWWTRGIAEATALFQLLQGIVLATLGWLYGSQGLERAEAAALEESERRAAVSVKADAAEGGARMAELELVTTRAILAALARDPELRRKIDEAAREVERA